MELSGIIPLLKPQGLTSHDCVYKLRKMLHTKKIGHAGTLDPDVTGVLPICIGRATKIVEYLHDLPKAYIGEVTIGFSTTTEDASGEVVERKQISEKLTADDILDIFSFFQGEITQIPPMYSAVKVNGKKLYEYARAGQSVERPVRKVTIYQLQLLDGPYKNDGGTYSFTFEVECSKGAYIRTLAVDLGQKLGYPAHLSYLERTKSGPFIKEDCLTFSDIERAVEEGVIGEKMYPLEKGIEQFPRITVDQKVEQKILNGAVLPLAKEIEASRFAIFNKQGKCLAIYQKHPTKIGFMKPEKMILRN